jgi:hypothetical protein
MRIEPRQIILDKLFGPTQVVIVNDDEIRVCGFGHTGKIWVLATSSSIDLVRLNETEEASEWSQRYKANVARLKSGEHDQIAEVVELLADRGATIGLSQGEQRMFDRAVRMLHDS